MRDDRLYLSNIKPIRNEPRSEAPTSLTLT
jgi:hypothetical protein